MSAASPNALSRLVRSISAIRDHRLHMASVQRFLEETEAAEAVECIRILMRDVSQPRYREAYQAIVGFFLHRGKVGYHLTGELYRQAARSGYEPVRFLMLRAPAMLEAHPDELLVDPELLDIPLGRRKSLARGHHRDMLLRLATDPTPSVALILLDNPKLLEADVVRVAARRPNKRQVLELVAWHRRWAPRYDVQRALAQNPYTPTSLAVALTPFLAQKHLAAIAGDAKLHGAVRTSARMVRGWRRERPH